MQEDKINEGVPLDAEPKWNRDEAERFLKTLHAKGNTFEIRILESLEQGCKSPGNSSGFFKDAKTAADVLDRFWDDHEGGHAYVTVNPVHGGLHDRAPDSFRWARAYIYCVAVTSLLCSSHEHSNERHSPARNRGL